MNSQFRTRVGLIWLLGAGLLLFPAARSVADDAVATSAEDASGAPAELGGDGAEATGSTAEAAPSKESSVEEAAAEEEDENLLSSENLLASGSEAAAGEHQGDSEDLSFGSALKAFGLQADISGYGEAVFKAEDGAFTFDQAHFVPIIGVQIGDNARAEIELEYEHGGSEQKVEYAFFEYVPARWLALRVGKFNIPIGYFNAVLHPSFRWNQADRPKMMDNIIPATWSEVGMQLFGRADLGPTAAFDYKLYVTNGLGYEKGTDLSSQPSFVRKLMRGNVLDNNIDKGVGGRLGLNVIAAQGAAKIISGLSVYTAAVDPAGSKRLSLIDYDLQVRVYDFLFRGEIAQSFWATAQTVGLVPLERGSYLQTAYTLGKWELAVRWDNVLIKPGMGDSELINRIVPTLKYAPDPLWSIRGEMEFELGNPINGFPPYDIMVAFSF